MYINLQVFNYTRRGLFDRDKLIVLTLLTFNIGEGMPQICELFAQPSRGCLGSTHSSMLTLSSYIRKPP